MVAMLALLFCSHARPDFRLDMVQIYIYRYLLFHLKSSRAGRSWTEHGWDGLILYFSGVLQVMFARSSSDGGSEAAGGMDFEPRYLIASTPRIVQRGCKSNFLGSGMVARYRTYLGTW
ncbi:hypothetical protein BJ508DRAFT_56682 [Ascobolus immersus RN42]|uniref:Uncharacterized protein n=1 Tax=Ascobolus immersus RN42 TaxID=1160509 RepID=A0A3N4IC51_ASCIM|nr:hypothetical protein BJ508DRAFT_56682 [Ascobolus immersus RN42]